MKVLDCFIFYNELCMLEYRLNILNDYVDYFILVESTHTHVGKEKELYYANNKQMFEKFNNKIIHIVVDDFPYKYPSIDTSIGQQWANENFQRNCIERGLSKVNVNEELQDEDIIIVSDLDEIPNPKILEDVRNKTILVTANCLRQDLYYYNLNTKFHDLWYHAKILTYEYYKKLNMSFNDIRINGNGVFPVIQNGGWHLSYFGDKYFIKNKIENFTHQEYNNETYTNLDTIETRMNKQCDIYGRPIPTIKISVKDNNNLPPKYDVYLKNFFLF